MTVTAFTLAQRFVGLKEVSGPMSNSMVLAMLQLDAGTSIKNDEVPWCSGFVNYIAWLLRLPRSKSLAARSWLAVGAPVSLPNATCGFDIVVLKRGTGKQPDASVLNAPGHVGWYAGQEGSFVHVLGGNQADSVSVARFPVSQILSIRSLVLNNS